MQKIRIRPAGCRNKLEGCGGKKFFFSNAYEKNVTESEEPIRIQDAQPYKTLYLTKPENLFSKSVGHLVGQICPTTKKPSRFLVRA